MLCTQFIVEQDSRGKGEMGWAEREEQPWGCTSPSHPELTQLTHWRLSLEKSSQRWDATYGGNDLLRQSTGQAPVRGADSHVQVSPLCQSSSIVSMPSAQHLNSLTESQAATELLHPAQVRYVDGGLFSSSLVSVDACPIWDGGHSSDSWSWKLQQWSEVLLKSLWQKRICHQKQPLGATGEEGKSKMHSSWAW